MSAFLETSPLPGMMPERMQQSRKRIRLQGSPETEGSSPAVKELPEWKEPWSLPSLLALTAAGQP